MEGVCKGRSHRDRKGSQRWFVSPQTSGKPRRTFVETTVAFDEISQRLFHVLVFCRVPQRTGPLAPRPVIDLVTVGRATNDGRERLRLSDRRTPSQAQRPRCTLAGPAIEYRRRLHSARSVRSVHPFMEPRDFEQVFSDKAVLLHRTESCLLHESEIGCRLATALAMTPPWAANIF